MKLAAFDMIPIEFLYDKIFDLPPTEPLSSNFEAVGFESLYIIYNLGSITLITLSIPLLMLILRVMLRFSLNNRIEDFAHKMEK